MKYFSAMKLIVISKVHALTKTQMAIVIFASIAMVIAGSVGTYALSVERTNSANETALTVSKQSILEKQAVINALSIADSASGATNANGASLPQEGSGSQTVPSPTQTAVNTKKTYTMTDGLTGQTTTYTEGCVTKRPGYPDPDCDARAGAASMPMPATPLTPTHLLAVRPGFNAIAQQCSSIYAPSAYFDISDARGGLAVAFRFEFDGDSPIMSDGTTPASSQTFSLTTHRDASAPNLQGFDSWYDNSMVWFLSPIATSGYTPSHAYRVHVTSPVDITSDWKTINFNYNC